MRDLGTASRFLRDEDVLPSRRTGRGEVAGILVEGEDAVLARELWSFPSVESYVGRGQAQAADLGAGGWVLDEGAWGRCPCLPAVVQRSWLKSVRAVIVGEGLR